jgi:hypothetical protein
VNRLKPRDSALVREAEAIRDALAAAFIGRIDGRQAILALKAADYNWRQMEWIGWYFEYKAREVLIKSLGGAVGPSFGHTRFDYRRSYVWDLKAHPRMNQAGKVNQWAVLNDQEAIHECISSLGGVGFVIAEGDATFDARGDFKRWHDALKGGVSKYETERIARGAHSRIRKTSFTLRAVEIVFFASNNDIKLGMQQGWLSSFQMGMRNSNGSARSAKYQINLANAPSWVRAVPAYRQ